MDVFLLLLLPLFLPFVAILCLFFVAPKRTYKDDMDDVWAKYVLTKHKRDREKEHLLSRRE